METESQTNILDFFARVIAVIFHPLLMPVYGLTIILSAPTLFGYLPADVKKLLILIMIVNNVLLPLSLLPLFIQRKIISSWTLTLRKDRVIPLIISTVLYGVTSYIILKFPIPAFFKTYLIATAFLSLVITVTNFRLRVSLHSAGSGAVLGLVLVLSIKMLAQLDLYLIAAIFTGSIVMFSRMKLDKHSPGEVWSGFFTGFVVIFLFMLLI